MIIRSIIFKTFVILWGMIVPIIYFDVFITRDSKRADRGALVWSRFILFVFKKLCKVDYEVRGLKNLPKKGGFVVACKHQSMWETVVMHVILEYPVYAYKKELLSIPIYGWFVARMSGISVDRKGGATALKNLIKSSEKFLNEGRKIILFPQGTRVPSGGSVDKYPYQPGITALYSKLNCTVVPAALNSGEFWGKNKTIQKSGKIIVEFLPPIDSKTDKKDFLPLLASVIEKKTDELVAEARKS